MSEQPDFEKLRRERDEAIKRIAEEVAKKHGWELPVAFHANYGGGSHDCYCACADGGPCEHEFNGWREHEDGLGGEQFCQRCGMGAMSHSVNTCWD